MFSKSDVEYATHQLSLYYGACFHACRYCFVNLYRRRKWAWSIGPTRQNPKAIDIALKAPRKNIGTLVVSFTSDPLPPDGTHDNLFYLIKILDILEERKINTKVLTKNPQIQNIVKFKPRYKYVSFGMSITTDSYNELTKQYWEPNTRSIISRYQALNLLHEHNFRTWISAEPLLPNTDISTLIREALFVEPEEIWIGKGNYYKKLVEGNDWVKIANEIHSIQQNNPISPVKIHMKKELATYVT